MAVAAEDNPSVGVLGGRRHRPHGAARAAGRAERWARQAEASDTLGDDIGGPRWSSLKTSVFVVAASAGLWGAICTCGYLVLHR